MLTIRVAPARASSVAGGPGSQMSSHTVSPTRSSPSCSTAPAGPGLKVAVLVEHAVVGQMDLAVDRVDGPVGEHRGGVVDLLGPLGEPHDGDHTVGLGGELVQSRAPHRPGSARGAAGPRAGSR